MTIPTEDARERIQRALSELSPGDEGVYVSASDLRALIEPPTADEREALKVALTEGYWKRTGYRVTWENIGPLMDAILAAGFRRQVSHPEPVTDAEVEAAERAWWESRANRITFPMRSALEAARVVRLPVPEEENGA